MTFRVRYIPIKDGDLVDLGTAGSLTSRLAYYATKPQHIVIGYKPGPGPRAAGWLVVLVDEAAKPHTKRPRRLRNSRAVPTEGSEA